MEVDEYFMTEVDVIGDPYHILTRLTEDRPLFQSGGAHLTPEHVAPVVAFLLTDASRSVAVMPSRARRTTSGGRCSRARASSS